MVWPSTSELSITTRCQAAPLRRLDRHLVAVPGLDSRQKALLPNFPTATSLEPDFGHAEGSPWAISVRAHWPSFPSLNK